MSSVSVEALRSFPYDGKERQKGDVFSAPLRHVTALAAAGKVRLSREEKPPAPQPMNRAQTARTVSAPRSRQGAQGGAGRGAGGRYARSDMSAARVQQEGET